MQQMLSKQERFVSQSTGLLKICQHDIMHATEVVIGAITVSNVQTKIYIDKQTNRPTQQTDRQTNKQTNIAADLQSKDGFCLSENRVVQPSCCYCHAGDESCERPHQGS